MATIPDNPGDTMLTSFLAERDISCPGCGYNLRGLTARSCPECNQGLRLMVGLEEPRLGSWIAGLLGTAAGAGFNGLLLFYALIMIAQGHGPGQGLMNTFVLYSAGALAVQGLLVAAWIKKGRSFRRAQAPTKIVLITAAWALAALDVFLCSLFIR